jgi:hypothetical protein
MIGWFHVGIGVFFGCGTPLQTSGQMSLGVLLDNPLNIRNILFLPFISSLSAIPDR